MKNMTISLGSKKSFGRWRLFLIASDGTTILDQVISEAKALQLKVAGIPVQG